MRYTETKEASAEILRLVIGEMAKHEAAYNPINYTVWYECISGFNRPLREAIQATIDRKLRLDTPKVESLFHEHVLGRTEALNRQIQHEFKRLLDELSGLVSDSSGSTDRYSQFLEECQNQLGGEPDPALLSRIIASLLVETREVRGSLTAMQQELQVRATEVDSLRRSLTEALGEAMIDPLTGLLNRRGFDQEMADALKQASEPNVGPLALMMVDIDHFKRINDTCGHLFGDQVIRTLAEVLSMGVKQRGAVGRWGGEEFAVLLRATSAAKACAVAETLRSTMAKIGFRQPKNQEQFNVTISMGIALHRPDENAESWIHRADIALYASKHGGRNRITLDEERAVA